MSNIVIDDTFDVVQPEVEKTDKVINTFMNGWFKRLLSNDNYLNKKQTALNTTLTNLGKKISTGSANIYVSANGSDSGDGTQTSPYKTIAKALSVLPSSTQGYNTINIMAEGTYDGVDIINDTVGLNIMVTGIILPYINITNNAWLNISGKTFTVDLSKGSKSQCITVDNRSCLISAQDVTLSCVSSSLMTVNVSNGSMLVLKNCTVNNAVGTVLSAYKNSRIFANTISGNSTPQTVMYSTSGSVITYAACSLSYTTLLKTDTGGAALKGALTTTAQDLISAINEVKTKADNTQTAIDKSRVKTEVTLSKSSWVSSDIYYIDVAVSRITSTGMTGNFGVVYTGVDTASLKTYLKQAGFIYTASIENVGYVRFKAIKLPTMDIKLWITLEE